MLSHDNSIYYKWINNVSPLEIYSVCSFFNYYNSSAVVLLCFPIVNYQLSIVNLFGGEYRARTDDPLRARQVL